MKVIAASNISDLLRIHEMIVFQKTAEEKFKEIDLEALLIDEAFKLELCDELVCLFSKQKWK